MTVPPNSNRLPRVVAIGFNKCGTRSLTELFRSAGHRVIHHKVRKPFTVSRSLGRIMRDNLSSGRKVFDGVEDYVFYSDLIYSTPTETYEGATAFREILRDYPDTILILNFRDREQWIASRLKHGHGEFTRREMTARRLENRDDLVDQWRSEWDAHLASARDFMASNPAQLIEFDIDRDGAAKLTEKLTHYNLTPETFRDIGRTRGIKRSKLLALAKKFVAHSRPRFRR